jgi:hypothetical protein
LGSVFVLFIGVAGHLYRGERVDEIKVAFVDNARFKPQKADFATDPFYFSFLEIMFEI